MPFLLTGLVPTAWSADGSRLLTQFGGQDTTYAVTVSPATGRERIVGKASQGIVATGLSRDGSTILGYTGGAAEEPDLEKWSGLPTSAACRRSSSVTPSARTGTASAVRR